MQWWILEYVKWKPIKLKTGQNPKSELNIKKKLLVVHMQNSLNIDELNKLSIHTTRCIPNNCEICSSQGSGVLITPDSMPGQNIRFSKA